jgi:hypothetical protein
MRKTFPGYYRPTEEEFTTLWNTCFFVLDANVLLNLYRYSQETRDDLIGILKQISDRLWVPHQAALEYQQNRLYEIHNQLSVYEDMKDFLEDIKNKFTNKLNVLTRHPSIDAGYLLKKINKTLKSLEKDLNRFKNSHPDLLQNDDVRDSLDTILEDKVGSPYSIDRLNEIYKIGKQRYEQKIPPGYLDDNKEGIRKFGDLVLWFQIKEKAKETNKPVILVTDDKKDDWWIKTKGKGQIIGPRPELIHEMYSESGVAFYQYQSDPFMVQAQKHLKSKVKQKTINEIRDIRHHDEEMIPHSIPDNFVKKMKDMEVSSAASLSRASLTSELIKSIEEMKSSSAASLSRASLASELIKSIEEMKSSSTASLSLASRASKSRKED